MQGQERETYGMEYKIQRRDKVQDKVQDGAADQRRTIHCVIQDSYLSTQTKKLHPTLPC